MENLLEKLQNMNPKNVSELFKTKPLYFQTIHFGGAIYDPAGWGIPRTFPGNPNFILSSEDIMIYTMERDGMKVLAAFIGGNYIPPGKFSVNSYQHFFPNGSKDSGEFVISNYNQRPYLLLK